MPQTPPDPLSKFKKKSTFFPPGVPNPTLSTFSKLVEGDIATLAKSKPTPTHFNISVLEKKAIKELKSDPKIVIFSADKGGSIVIQNSEDYVAEAKRQLNNGTCYKQLPGNPSELYMGERDDILDRALGNNLITKKQYEFLKIQYPSTPVLYLLPKIHKSLIHPPGRPIISGKNSISEPLSQFIDFFIKDIVKDLPSYIADTRDVIRLLSDMNIPKESFLVSFDVESLYTNIPHEGGIEAMSYFLEPQKDNLPVKILLELSELILKTNYFMFDKKYYVQTQGSAMGSPFSPNYANLYMGLWEKRYISDESVNPLLKHVLFWIRYIDDILLVFTGTEDELFEFRDYINNTYSTLKFTMEYDKEKIHFLDVLISVDMMGNLETSIFRKSTDRNTILHAQSYHPKEMIGNIPYGQFLRLKRICSKESDYDIQANEMQQRFVQRGYDRKTINKAFERAKEVDRNTLLEPNSSKVTSDNKITFVSEFSNVSKDVKRIVLKHWSVLKCDPQLVDLASSTPRFCFKRGSNIKDSLVSSMYVAPSLSTNWLSQEVYGNYRCGRCTHCSNTYNTKKFYHPHTGQEYTIKDFINCNSTHIVYMLKCICGDIYIGQTKRNLKLRIAEHKAAIRNGNMDYAIARHCREKNHGSVVSLKFLGIERISPSPRGGNIVKQLLQREAYWIYTLNTMEPRGLNENLDLSSFL